MPHGIDAYFDELARDRRRVAAIGTAVALAALLIEALAMRRAIVEALNDPKRFGFEGEEQYVRRIILETVGEVNQPGKEAQNVVSVEMHAGGGGTQAGAALHRKGERPAPERPGPGAGVDPNDLETRLRALALQGPIVRSEDLVVEKLVRPEYPEEARDQEIEGVVEMVARVDTTGAVTEVHIIGGSHQPLLESAATSAVLQCVYRPYRVRANAEAVWAYYRVSFKLY
jgi:TonB family protein